MHPRALAQIDDADNAANERDGDQREQHREMGFRKRRRAGRAALAARTVLPVPPGILPARKNGSDRERDRDSQDDERERRS